MGKTRTTPAAAASSSREAPPNLTRRASKLPVRTPTTTTTSTSTPNSSASALNSTTFYTASPTTPHPTHTPLGVPRASQLRSTFEKRVAASTMAKNVKAKAIASSPTKRKAQPITSTPVKANTSSVAQNSDSNNNNNNDSVAGKRRRVQAKPYQVPDVIPPKILQRLLADTSSSSTSSTAGPSTSSSSNTTQSTAGQNSTSKHPKRATAAADKKIASKKPKVPTLQPKSNSKKTIAAETTKIVNAPKSKPGAKITTKKTAQTKQSECRRSNSGPGLIATKKKTAQFSVATKTAAASRKSASSQSSATSAKIVAIVEASKSGKPVQRQKSTLKKLSTTSKAIVKKKRVSTAKLPFTDLPSLVIPAAAPAAVPISPKKRTTKQQRKVASPTAAAAVAGPSSSSFILSSAVLSPTPSPKKSPRKKQLALIPRPAVTKYIVDPTFESTIHLPFISTLAHSKLLIRAVLAGNNAELESLMKQTDQIASFCVQRSLNNPFDAFYYALQTKNLQAIQLLVNSTKLAEKLAPFPEISLQAESTGQASYRMFGHAMRNVSVARGSKEGNDALIKDRRQYDAYGSPRIRSSYFDHEIAEICLVHGYSWESMKQVAGIFKDSDTYADREILDQVYRAVWRGQNKVAGALVEEAITKGGYGFGQLHKEALTLANNVSFTPFKSISITKKASNGNGRITPVHCAAINPNPLYLKTLLSIRPDFNLPDFHGKTPLHFAAACSGTGPLEYLLSHGMSLKVVDKEGKTPLYIAAELGRVENVRVIITAQAFLEGDGSGGASVATDSNKDQFIDHANLKNGLSPLHIAIKNGHIGVVNELLHLGANAEKTLSAQYDKLTPAMIAAQHGHLTILQLLIEKGEINIEAVDKRGKSALTHAVIDGQGHIVSYLLRLGVNNNVKDTSGNTLAHYAAAYGWFFNWNLLMEAGCAPNEPNDWKMTPLGIAFLKGQMGLVQLILTQPGVDINAPIDDTTGQNLLLQICSSKLGDSFVSKLKFLVHDQKANCDSIDLEKCNALHYLVRTEFEEIEKRLDSYDWMKQEEMKKIPGHKKFGKDKQAVSILSSETFSNYHSLEELVKNRLYIYEAVSLLLKGGCNPNAINSENESPATLAFKYGCIELISVFLENGFSFESVQEPNKEGDTILHQLIKCFSNQSIKTCRRVQIKEFMVTISKEQTVLKAFREMSKVKNIDGYTPLHYLLKCFVDVTTSSSTDNNKPEEEEEDASSANEDDEDEEDDEDQEEDEESTPKRPRSSFGHSRLSNSRQIHSKPKPETNNGNNGKTSKLVNYYTDCLSFLINELESDVNMIVEDKTKRSPLHLAVSRDTLCTESIQQLLTKKPNLDALNEEQKTPLTVAVLKQNQKAAQFLIEAGANVNFVSINDKNKTLLILAAENFSNGFNIIPNLIQKGVDLQAIDSKIGNSILHLLAMKPNVIGVIETFGLLIRSGCDVAKPNFRGQTPLHLVLNQRAGETDVSYDLEELLIETDPNALIVADMKERIPLHYAFIKQCNETGVDLPTTKMDPIELVALLTRSTKLRSPQAIHSKDIHKSTPLHYAATCGSIISISLLISELKQFPSFRQTSIIDELNEDGNTPFGLAVWNRNDGAALQFEQNDANFLATLNTYKTPKKDKAKTPDYEWKYVQELREEGIRELRLKCKFTILQEVINQNQQGLLHLMLEKLSNSSVSAGRGISNAIEASLKTNRFKLALKLLKRIKSNDNESLKLKNTELGTLFHILASSELGENSAAQNEVIAALLSRGIPLRGSDGHRSIPLIYAAINWNTNLCTEFTRLMTVSEAAKLSPDLLSRTPFSALFWKLAKKGGGGATGSGLPDQLKEWAANLVHHGASSNVLTRYPIRLSKYPGIGCLSVNDDGLNLNQTPLKISPLIMAVLCRNYEVVKWLLGLGKVGYEKHTDVDFQDEFGRTALMYAVKLNDIKMVKLLLNPRAYDHTKDERPWSDNNRNKTSKTFTVSTNPNLGLHDSNGWTVLHHLVSPFPSFSSNISFLHSIKILQLLTSSIGLASQALELRTNDLNQTVLDLAKSSTKHQLLIDHLEQILRVPTTQRTKIGLSYDFVKIQSVEEDASAPVVVVDSNSDSQEMLQKLQDRMEVDDDDGGGAEAEGSSNSNKYNLKPDTLIGMKKGHAIILQDSTQDNLPFDTLLTQVDLSYGIYGLYNYYKMQIVKQIHGKELILLFTRWGRVGTTGQYQKTPFPDEDSAIKEFKKIFRAKTGNSWETLGTFSPQPKKYRLVNLERRKVKKGVLSKVKVDFDEIEKATKDKTLSIIKNEGLAKLIEKLALVHKPKTENKRKVDDDEEDDYVEGYGLPLGLLDKETLLKGNQILDDISKLLQAKEKLSKENRANDEYSTVYASLVKLSEEYYTMIPVHGFSFERIEPIFDFNKLRENQLQIHHLVHLEFATKLLLGSQLRAQTMHPFDYVYKGLNTKLQLMDGQSEETQLILQYIHNTGKSSPKVEALFRIERPGEMERLNELGIENRWLLWHGTRTKNILNILNTGLEAVPIGVSLNGHLFGKGIYFADMFEKSNHYSLHDGASTDSTKFMFLCEVALGKIQDVDVHSSKVFDSASLEAGYHSFKSYNSKYEPDPGTTILWNGRTVPLGKKVQNILEQPANKDEQRIYHGLDMNEYVIFDKKQICLRYLVQYRD